MVNPCRSFHGSRKLFHACRQSHRTLLHLRPRFQWLGVSKQFHESHGTVCSTICSAACYMNKVSTTVSRLANALSISGRMLTTEENFILDLGISIALDSFHRDVRSSLLSFSPIEEEMDFSHDTGSALAVASLSINKLGHVIVSKDQIVFRRLGEDLSA